MLTVSEVNAKGEGQLLLRGGHKEGIQSPEESWLSKSMGSFLLFLTPLAVCAQPALTARSLTFLKQLLLHLLFSPQENCYVQCGAAYSSQGTTAPLGCEFLDGLLPRKQTLEREGTCTVQWKLLLKGLIKPLWLS